VGISYNENIDPVLQILKEVGEALEKDSHLKSSILEPPQVLGIENFEETQIIIRILIKTRPLKQWEIAREYRRRVKAAFEHRGIVTVTPQRVVHQEKSGKV
jgi:small conductance mechanosensitive channel